MDTRLSFFGRKRLPQGSTLPLLTSPHPNQFQVPGLPWAGSKVPGRDRYPREVGAGSQLSNSHSPTMNRAGTSPLLLGLVPGTEGCHLHLSSASILQMGQSSSGSKKQSWEEQTQDPRRGLLPSDLVAVRELRMESGWLLEW